MASTATVPFYHHRYGPKMKVVANGGLTSTTDPHVLLTIYPDPSYDTDPYTDMLVYGAGLDSKTDPLVGSVSGNSVWQPYRNQYPVVLSAGAGSKVINVDVRGRSRNGQVGDPLTLAYTLNADAPIVTMLRGPVPDWSQVYVNYHGTIDFDYRIDQQCNQIDVCAVTNPNATHDQAAVINSFSNTYVAGQLFTSVGSNSFMATVDISDFAAAGSTLDSGTYMVKVFARRSTDSVWSL